MKTPIEADAYDLAIVPTVAAYKAALEACDPGPDSAARLMLVAHYRSPARALTAGELARAMGYSTFSTVNLLYGKFAVRLCEVLSRWPGVRLSDHAGRDLLLDEDAVTVAVLVTFGEQSGSEQILWRMLPNVATALEELGWVPPA